MKLRIHPSFYLYIISLYLLGKMKFIIIFILCFIVHELGHITLIKLSKLKIKKLTVFAYGGVLETNINANNNCYIEIAIFSAGVIFNLIFAIISYIIGIKELTLVNLIFFLFNIVPIYPIDGYYIILNLLSLKLPFYKALKLSKLISLTTLCFFVIISLFINLYLIIVSIILFIYNLNNYRDYKLVDSFMLDKYLHPSKKLKNKEIEANINLKEALYKGKNNYLMLNNKIYYENDLLNRIYKKSAI